jgi:phenylpropionate dioxygenase-like ring-hydroxylating dioxygenase large terminal subunit
MTTSPDRLASDKPRMPRPTLNDWVRQDTRAGWPFTEESFVDLGSEDLAKERYFSREFHELEVDRMWKRVWQMACRVEDIPDPGDTVVYDLADLSVGVVRVDRDTIKAFYNSCLHRGTALFAGAERVEEIRCPFHGMCWRLDGTLAQMPCRWDFPHIEAHSFALPEVRVDTWAGFVFVNFDPAAPPLADYVGDLARHNEALAHPWERRYKAVHVAKVIPINWKAGMEAFIEAYHVPMTHGFGGVHNSSGQYDLWDGQPHFSRAAFGRHPDAPASPELSGGRVQAIREKDVDNRARWAAKATPADPWSCFEEVTDPEERRVILAAAKGYREGLAEVTGDDVSHISDSEVNVYWEYFLFPNLMPWAGPFGFSGDLCYRFRPNGNDPDSSIMEVMMLYPFGSKGHPPASRLRWLDPDEPWSSVRELGSTGLILDQDDDNFARIQKGLKAGGKPGITLARYQESRIRHYHATLDAYLQA